MLSQSTASERHGARERKTGRERYGLSRKARRGVDRHVRAEPGRRPHGRAGAWRLDPDPRRNAGNRGHQPSLFGERRALHDRDDDVSVGHRKPENHGHHVHSRRPPPRHGCVTTSPSLSPSSTTSSSANCSPRVYRRDGDDGPFRCGDRPRRRHSPRRSRATSIRCRAIFSIRPIPA